MLERFFFSVSACEVAVLISLSQTCFFCTQNIRGRRTLLALEHAPPWPLSAQINGSPRAAYYRRTTRRTHLLFPRFTALKRLLRQIKIIPAALKTHSQNQIQHMGYHLCHLWGEELTHRFVYFRRCKDIKDSLPNSTWSCMKDWGEKGIW